MLGALIGNLAAATAKTRRDIFFLQLIGPKARLSESGFTILAAIKYNLVKEQGDTPVFSDIYEKMLASIPKFLTYFSRDFNEGGQDFVSSPATLMMRTVVCAWWYSDPAEAYDVVFEMLQEPWADKEERYAVKFLIDIIHLLRSGFSKDATYDLLDNMFKDCITKPRWMQGDGLLSRLFRAWDAFYQSHDFGSAVNNAMQLPGDPRFNAALCGSMAEAMYGSLYYLRKKKYIGDDEPGVIITIPQAINEYFAPEMLAMMQKYVIYHRFFPKNNSRTNVEWHQYEGIENIYYGRQLNPEQYDKILRGEVAEDNSEGYGIYLDNGSFYICRDWEIYCRFRILLQQEEVYQVSGLQRASEISYPDAVNAFDSIMRKAFERSEQ